MAVSKAQQKAVQKYMKANYDEIKIRVPKGKREQYRAIAEANGISLNAWIVQIVEIAAESYFSQRLFFYILTYPISNAILQSMLLTC